jgi:hypothetical protein
VTSPISAETYPREWAGVMPGDVVRSTDGLPWVVRRAEPERVGQRVSIWAELDGGGVRGTRVVQLPAGSVLVEMAEGPGWGMAGCGEEAMQWAAGLVADVLGAVEATDVVPGDGEIGGG